MIEALIARFGIKAVEYAVLAFLVFGGVSAGVGYIHHQGVVAERDRVEREKQEAINVARKAKDFIHSRCNVDPDNCVSDEWFRD